MTSFYQRATTWLRNHLFITLIACLGLGALVNNEYYKWRNEQTRIELREKLAATKARDEKQAADFAAQMGAQNDPDQLTAALVPSTTVLVPRAWVYQPPQLPAVDVDILAKLNVTIEIPSQVRETHPNIERNIRAAADASYRRLGIADSSVQGWTLTIEPTDSFGIATTEHRPEAKRAIITINPLHVWLSGPHELTHFLMGQTSFNKRLPNSIEEFVCQAANVFEVPASQAPPLSYDRLNRPVFGTARTGFGEQNRLGVASGSPHDMFRYQILLAAGKKIGEANYLAMAKDIYQLGSASKEPVTLAQVKPLFEQYNLGDCVIFQSTTTPGLYVDLVVDDNSMPAIFYKKIDGDGMEVPLQGSPLKLAWKKGSETLAFGMFGTDPGGVLTDDLGRELAHVADALEVTIEDKTYRFEFDNGVNSYTYR